MKLTLRFLTTLLLLSNISQAVNAADAEFDKIEAVVNKELILKSDMITMKRDIIERYNKLCTLPVKGFLTNQSPLCLIY